MHEMSILNIGYYFISFQELVAQPLGPVKGKGKGKKAAAGGAATKVESAPAVETKA